ncbi:MAG: UDP-N-acetylmuramate--L-alanine ligase [Saprospiraceae bacterium]|nr:UDP-N-acetylmuramate--L-alanine ligase [Saprospiraceae bacterium]
MMMDDTKHIYFVGIGGIGMSAIARYFVARGQRVSGYDKTKTLLTEKLEQEGMYIHYEDEVSLIPKDIDTVIFTPAIPEDHKGMKHLRDHGFAMMKRSEALGLISNDMRSIAIAGTHGKTTTSSMTAHVLKVGGIDVSAFLGGIAADYKSNFLIGKSDVVVLEADEYDRSFLRLSPFFAAILSMDPDHLDIYGDKDQMIEGYKAFAAKIRDNGVLIIKTGLLGKFKLNELFSLSGRNVKVFEFGVDEGDIRLSNIGIEAGKFVFDYSGLGVKYNKVALNLPGRHNVENACVALTMGILCGVEEDKIRFALSEFKGIQRRFEKIVETNEVVFIDDYAHHPSELSAAIDAARTLYAAKKLTGIFQPHLYSRTRDFADGFAVELDKLDEVFLMDIYPARELPMQGVTSQMIFERMKNKHKTLVTKETLMSSLEGKSFEVLLTLGAGDIDTFVPLIKEMLINKNY